MEGCLFRQRSPCEADGKHDGQLLKAKAALTSAFVQRMENLDRMLDAHS